tara:strand:+ start:708 stop:2669 length:1962 start_codon:yes stop_codon:yes gene_type:complete
VNFTQQPVVRAVTSGGTVATGFTGNITIAVFSGSGSLSGTATVAAVAGVATFTNLKITGAGHHILSAAASGLTTAYSGYVTVNPAAPSAISGSTFVQSTTDRMDIGSNAVLDNLPQGKFSVVAMVKRTGSGSNLHIATKDNSFPSGWFLACDNPSAEGQISFGAIKTPWVNIATSATYALSNTSNVVAQDVVTFVGGTFDDTASPCVKLYKGTESAIMAEVTGYENQYGPGAGSFAGDAAANYYIGNLQRANTNSFRGTIYWIATFSKVLTPAQVQTVQMGMLRGNSAMITGVGSCVDLHNLPTTTDLSGNSNTGTTTGTTTATGPTVYSPSVWGASDDATNVSNLYLSTITKSEVSYSTSATTLTVGSYRGADLGSTYNSQAALSVFENGAYKGQILNSVSAGGYQVGALSLTAGSKTVTIRSSPHTRSGSAGTGDDALGVVPVTVEFGASATEVIPATPTATWLISHDSILDGFVTDPVGSNSPNDVMRTYMAGLSGTPQWITNGYGGQTVYKLALDATARTNSAAAIALYNPQFILINLGVNDYANNLWSAASFETAYAAWLVAINAVCPNATIYALTPFTKAGGEGANGSGSTLGNYRTAISNAASGKAYVAVLDGPTVWNGTNNSDGTHPNNTGAAALVANLKTALGV